MTETPAIGRPVLAAASSSRNGVIAFAVFAVALVVYLSNGDVLPGQDAKPNVDLPQNILRHGRLTFSPQDWPGMFSATGGRLEPKYYLSPSDRRDADGSPLYISCFGIGAGLTALPVFVAAQAVGIDLDSGNTRWHLGKLAASLCCAGAVMLFFLIAAQCLPHTIALWVAAAFGFGTCVWSASSQTLWQHGPSALFLMLGAWCLLNHRDSARFAALAGAALAWAVFCRPTGAVPLGIAGVYLLLTQRKLAFAYAAGAAPLLALLAAYNTYYLGSPLNFGQLVSSKALALYTTGSSELWSTPFWIGASGQLLSPSRGLLVFSPIYFAAFAGIVVAWRSREFAKFRMASIAALAMLMLDMKWYCWWGGWSYGYRIKADAAVMLALMLIPAMPGLLKYRFARTVFLLMLAWSVGVQWLGAYAYDVNGWNNRYIAFWVGKPGDGQRRILSPEQVQRAVQEGVQNLDLEPIEGNVDEPQFRYRLWLIADSQIPYYVSHFSEARARRAEGSESLE